MLGNSPFGIGASAWTAMSSSKRAMVVSPAELSQAGRMPDESRLLGRVIGCDWRTPLRAAPPILSFACTASQELSWSMPLRAASPILSFAVGLAPLCCLWGCAADFS